ncbi:hypothetical protein Tco_1354388 [Tanacetum coccineum]
MHTRSQTRNCNRQQQAPPAVVESFNLEEPFDNPPLVLMADNQTMAELLQAPTEGYEDAIVIPEINTNFELKHGLINLVQNNQFFGHDKEDPHAHIRYFNKITSTFVNSNTASSSSSGSLPSNTVTNPKEDLKGITTRSGVAYQGPTIPTTSSPRVVERRTEVTKDTVFPTNNGITKDVQPLVVPFLADFVVVDFEQDPRVPLILERCFLKTGYALIDVYEGELTLRVGNEAITYNLDQTSRYLVNYNDMTTNRIDVVELACEEYSQEIIGFSDVIASGNNTHGYDPIVSILPDSHFLSGYLTSDPSPTSEPRGNYLSEIRKELKICEAKTAKSSIDEPPEVELKDLPPYLEYAFLEDNNKLLVIIAKDLSINEKAALIKVLKSRKRVIAWKLFDIKGINPEFCSHKILMEEDYEPAV